MTGDRSEHNIRLFTRLCGEWTGLKLKQLSPICVIPTYILIQVHYDMLIHKYSLFKRLFWVKYMRQYIQKQIKPIHFCHNTKLLPD